MAIQREHYLAAQAAKGQPTGFLYNMKGRVLFTQLLLPHITIT
jgi:hypothetical protein